MFGPLLARAKAHPALSAASRQAFDPLQANAGGRDEALRRWAMVHDLAHLLLDGATPHGEDMDPLIDCVIS